MKAPSGQVIIKEDPHVFSKTLIIENDLEPLRDTSSGVVVAKGDKTSHSSIPELSEGDRILYRSLTIEKNGKRVNRNEFTLDHEAYVSVPFGDILAIWN